jgi:hypothetical protein
MPFNPNQKRDPKGSSTGGEWTKAYAAARVGAGLRPENLVLGMAQLEIAGTKIGSPEPIYEIKDATNLLKFKAIAVGITGENKGRIFATNSMVNHQYLLNEAGIGTNRRDTDIDNYVRFNVDGSGEYLLADLKTSGLSPEGSEDWQVAMIDNIYKAGEYLTKAGLPKGTAVTVSNRFRVGVQELHF